MSDTAAIVDLAVLAAELESSERRLWSLLVAGEVPGAMYLPRRHRWYLPDAAVEQLRRLI